MKVILHMHDFIGELPVTIKQKIDEVSQQRRYSAGQEVYANGQVSNEVYRIKSGTVKLCNYSLDGDEIITGEFKAGDCFGEMGVIDGMPRVSYAIASEPVILDVISSKQFNLLRDQHPEIERAITMVLCRRVRLLYSLNEESTGLRLTDRLARILHRLAYSHGSEVNTGGIAVKISHENLSKMLGASRQSVSKVLKQLEGQGDIVLQYGKIVIPALENLARKYEIEIGMQQVAASYVAP